MKKTISHADYVINQQMADYKLNLDLNNVPQDDKRRAQAYPLIQSDASSFGVADAAYNEVLGSHNSSESVFELQYDGINVKYSKDVDGNPDRERPYIAVKVRYDVKPPKIFMVEDGVKTLLSEDTVGVLDSADIVRADLVITPVFYDVNGNTGFSNYLKTGYITIEADEFASRYADMETR